VRLLSGTSIVRSLSRLLLVVLRRHGLLSRLLLVRRQLLSLDMLALVRVVLDELVGLLHIQLSNGRCHQCFGMPTDLVDLIQRRKRPLLT